MTLRFLIVCLVLACRAGRPPATATAAETDTRELERAVAHLINAHRVSRHLAALRYDSAVAAIARGHSVEMASHRVPMGHDGFARRADAVQRRMAFDEIAENVALNDYPPARTVDVAVRGWLHSPHHLENIEGPFTVTGVGVVRASDGTFYYTQLFVARRR
jgi:uncharacterized protein YkwD